VTEEPPPFTSLADAYRAAVDGDGPVNERLTLFADTLRRLDPDFTAILDRFVARLESVGAGRSAPAVGELMPEFVLPDEEGHLVTLGGYLARGPVVVALHRGHWCPFCRINARALSQAHDTVSALGGSLVAITPDSAGFAARLRASSQSRFPILVDVDNGYALSLNLAIWLDQEMRERLSGFGVTLDAYQGNPLWMLPIPATFIVGTDGRVKARFIDPDYRRRMNVDDLLRAVEAARQEGP